MRIKSYYSRSVEGALAAAREELGSDAMLVESRKTASEARHLGEYEVVVALTSTAPEAVAPAERSAAPGGDRLSQDVAELKKELEAMRRAITRTAFAPPQWLSGAPGLSDAYAILTANEVAPDLAREIRAGRGVPRGRLLAHSHSPHSNSRARFGRLSTRLDSGTGIALHSPTGR